LSTRQLAATLEKQGYRIGRQTVATLLDEMGYSLQGNQKTREGASYPDRDAQCHCIHNRIEDFQRRGQPVVAIDTKKKAMVSEGQKGGREWRQQGNPEPARVEDCIDTTVGTVTPYGIHAPAANGGWVSVGVDHDRAEFAVETLRRWWEKMGCTRYPGAIERLLTADGGGSQWRGSTVEGGATSVGGPDQTAPLGVPCSAGDQLVEYDRTSDVQPHQHELARKAADQPRSLRQPHHGDHDSDRSSNPGGN
jgi:hypothetical protein